MQKGRDIWWHEEMQKASHDCPVEIMDSEDPLFILYTSGSTGKPKGIQHSTAGYMVYTEFFSAMFFNIMKEMFIGVLPILDG